MNTETLIGIAASVCTAVAMIPQLVKIIREKKAEDVSLTMMAVLFVGLVLWIYYGILKKDWILIIANGFSITINMLVGFFTIKYKK